MSRLAGSSAAVLRSVVAGPVRRIRHAAGDVSAVGAGAAHVVSCDEEDHRISREVVAGRPEFDRLQCLHEAAIGCLVEERLDRLTPGMRSLSVLFVFCGEIDNGGFCSCMGNSTGDLTAKAIDAARHIGADSHAEIFKRFATIGLADDLSMSQGARNRRLQTMSESDLQTLERLDEAFYLQPSIDGLLIRYVEAHPNEFFSDS